MDLKESNVVNDIQDQAISIPHELQNSAMKIIDYAELPQNRRLVFMASLEAFRKLDDKTVVNSNVQRLKEVISEVFLEIYQAVLKKTAVETKQDILINMFLNFGFMDEKLLTVKQNIALYELILGNHANESKYLIYDMKKWMNYIYTGEKEPSINENSLDYYDSFREKVKRGQLNEKDRITYEQNLDGRLKHECNGLFGVAQRLCYGRMGGYLPILHSDMISGDISKSLVTPEKIAASLDRILAVDYSAFHREVVYNKHEIGISNELIMLPVMPEIILIPTFGSRAVMWQEISGKTKSTPGRFIIPILTSENLDMIMLDLVAKFRWELSRRMSSSSLNGATESSLVNDYTTYIQFYKKNPDLSRETKTKIKEQINRNRSNIKEIFTSDYKVWINFESKGLIRLNRVARKILFKYCTFSREILKQMEKHPVYTQDIVRLNNLRNKKLKFINARYEKVIKKGKSLDDELKKNLEYYQS